MTLGQCVPRTTLTKAQTCDKIACDIRELAISVAWLYQLTASEEILCGTVTLATVRAYSKSEIDDLVSVAMPA